jgi:hypothetical protein
VAATEAIDYRVAGPLTAIDPDLPAHLAALPATPVELCRVAQGLVIPPPLASAVGIGEEREAEKSIRRASELIRVLRALDPASLDEARSPQRRIVGTCRHFAVLSVALLRFRGFAARARCGFAAYFVAEKFVDHWITEYWLADEQRWVRVDSEILGLPFVSKPDDLLPGEFLTAGEAWAFCRDDGIDPARFGVDGVEHAWGIGEVRGNAIRDLAALNQVEMLPWDEWGRMDASYKGRTGPEYDALMDEIAAVCASNDPSAFRDLYERHDLAVPTHMIA